MQFSHCSGVSSIKSRLLSTLASAQRLDWLYERDDWDDWEVKCVVNPSTRFKTIQGCKALWFFDIEATCRQGWDLQQHLEYLRSCGHRACRGSGPRPRHCQCTQLFKPFAECAEGMFSCHCGGANKKKSFHYIFRGGGGQGGPEIHELFEIIFDSDESCSVLSPSTVQRSG